MTVGFEADIDNAMGTRREQRNSEAKKGYIETAINYVSGLSTRAKTGLAAVGVFVAGFGVSYILNREMPASTQGSQEFDLEDLKSVNKSLGELIEVAGDDPLNPKQQEPDREARMKSIRDKLGELRGAFEEGGKSQSPLETAYGLGIRMPVILGNGYVGDFAAEQELTIAAGILSGDVKVTRTERGYTTNGQFSRYQNQVGFDDVCRRADVNGDKVITLQEARSIASLISK